MSDTTDERPDGDTSAWEAHEDHLAAQRDRKTDCDQCSGAAWVRIAGHVTGAPSAYETATECRACNPEGRIPYTGQVAFCDREPHHLAHQLAPGEFDPNCPACTYQPF